MQILQTVEPCGFAGKDTPEIPDHTDSRGALLEHALLRTSHVAVLNRFEIREE